MVSDIRIAADGRYPAGYYGFSRKELEKGLKWLKGIDSGEQMDMLVELYQESFGCQNKLRLVMDPVQETYWNTPDVGVTEYYQKRGVMSPRCFVELRGGWSDGFDVEEMSWDVVDNPEDGEYCILRSDWDRGRVEEYEVTDDMLDDKGYDVFLSDTDRDDLAKKYMFFNVGDEVVDGFDWVQYVSGTWEEHGLEDGIDEWIEEFEEVLDHLE